MECINIKMIRPPHTAHSTHIICVLFRHVDYWLFLASPWLPDGARYEQQRPITLAVREAASKQFCCSPHFRGGKIHLHSRGLTLLARGRIGSFIRMNGAMAPSLTVTPSNVAAKATFAEREIARPNAHGDCCFEKRAGRSESTRGTILALVDHLTS